ncbi:DinB family protein [Thalassococcus sp. S3]|uniref:DinB family protein n=1 Tax=Thalassococcus sp. S3 TaxID=2017482 RepID=UPI0010247331|nr:DinB family protein [Thalassococcus sp. S3]QBF32072.1 damage-inducible protein DinB [Thalassococcus sp. S3]
MIGRDYCVTMARYNAWQNSLLAGALDALGAEALSQDRGAFFGSIQRTVNHILWGDHLWISRFDGGAGPDIGGLDGLQAFETLAGWRAERERMDGRISLWAASVEEADLAGDLTWHASMSGMDLTKPMALCVMQFFNHQTHHRGQVHAMLTAAGGEGYVTDLPYMPEAG